MMGDHVDDLQEAILATEAPFQMTLPLFSQLLEPAGIAPALDFDTSGRLLCNQVPSLELRARVRFIIDRSVAFELGNDNEVRRLLKHWRADLLPQLEGSEEEDFVSGFEDDEFDDDQSENCCEQLDEMQHGRDDFDCHQVRASAFHCISICIELFVH